MVTGSNQGNGLAIAKGLELAGAKVVCIDCKFDNHSSESHIRFDLNEHEKIPDLIKKIVTRFGQIDGLVNNAGITIDSKHPYSDLQSFEKTLSINLTAGFVISSEVCKAMELQSYGSIINITSLGAELGFPNNPSYQASKAGLKQLTKALASDWSSKGIRINNICPGYIRTSMTEKSFQNSERRSQRQNMTFLKRWGIPDDLVGPTIFLLSDASSYITGTTIYVDGGWTANGGI